MHAQVGRSLCLCVDSTQYVLYMRHVCMYILLAALLTGRWKCLISFSTNQSLPVSLPLLPSLPLSPPFTLIALPQLFPAVTLFLCQTFLPPVPYQRPSSSSLPASLYLPLYNWWEAGVVFSVNLFISSLLLCCLGVKMVRVPRDFGVGGGVWEMQIIFS